MPTATTINRIVIPLWRPASSNEFRTVGRKIKIKRSDRDMVCGYALLHGTPRAGGRRRVSLEITLGPRDRECDPDNLWKSLLDALKHAKMLIDDRRAYCECGDVSFGRGEQLSTKIILEDID